MATLIGVDGTRAEVELPRDLEGLQALVDGMIEFIWFRDGTAMMVNEEGKVLGLSDNDAATEVLYGKSLDFVGQDYIVGRAVLLTADEARAMREEG